MQRFFSFLKPESEQKKPPQAKTEDQPDQKMFDNVSSIAKTRDEKQLITAYKNGDIRYWTISISDSNVLLTHDKTKDCKTTLEDPRCFVHANYLFVESEYDGYEKHRVNPLTKEYTSIPRQPMGKKLVSLNDDTILITKRDSTLSTFFYISNNLTLLPLDSPEGYRFCGYNITVTLDKSKILAHCVELSSQITSFQVKSEAEQKWTNYGAIFPSDMRMEILCTLSNTIAVTQTCKDLAASTFFFINLKQQTILQYEPIENIDLIWDDSVIRIQENLFIVSSCSAVSSYFMIDISQDILEFIPFKVLRNQRIKNFLKNVSSERLVTLSNGLIITDKGIYDEAKTICEQIEQTKLTARTHLLNHLHNDVVNIILGFYGSNLGIFGQVKQIVPAGPPKKYEAVLKPT